MRIVVLTAGVRGIGSYCINLYHMLRAAGHDVLLISERPWEKEPIDSFYQARSFMLFNMAPVVTKPRGVVEAILEFEPDIIHHHWPCGTMDFLFGRIARHRIPYIVTLHVSIASKQHILDRFWYRLFGLFKRWTVRAAAVNCISDFVRDQLNQRVNIDPARVHRIYAGVNETVFHPEVTAAQESIELLFVGQIMPEKGIDMLVHAVIEASHKRPELRLTIVGVGPLERRLRHLSEGNPHIRWIGFLRGQPAIAARYAAADATVLPTRWDEAFSLVPIESFACGTPVIASARGGTVEQVTDGVTGYLLREGTTDELVRRLESLDRQELRAMRPACRRLVLERHTFNKMAEGHEQLYRSVLQSRPGGHQAP